MFKKYNRRRGIENPCFHKILLIMRLTTVFIIAAIMQVSASGFAQCVTFNAKGVSLQELFKAIKTQTDYNVVMSAEKLEAAKPISADFKNEPLEKVLEASLEGQNLTYTIDKKTIVIREKEPSFLDNIIARFNAIDVRGVVTDSLGNPLQGATVKVKGSSTQVNTSAKGEFYIANVDENAVLVVSYVGYVSREVKAEKDLGMIRLVMASAELEEVNIASTGYQKVKPNEVTGSLVVIDNKTLNQQVGTNILQRLDGVTSSFRFDNKNANPGKRMNITVRGLSTINGPQDPLIVLDGFIYEGNINNINPNIVENITVLKDAAAASIWGARAGNGVIVITTKNGKFNQKSQVDFTTNVIVNERPDLYYLPQMSSADYIDVEQFLYNKGYFNNQFTNNTRPGITPAVEIFRRRSLGLITAPDSASQIDQLKKMDVRNDYNKYFYTQAVTQQYSVGLSGGGNNNSYFVAVGFDKVLSELYAKSNKLNVKVGNTYRPLKNLQANFSVNYTNSKSESGRPAYPGITVNNRQVPYLQFADDNGDPVGVDFNLRGIYTDTVGQGKLLNWKYYPLENYKHNTTTNNLQEIFLNSSLSYRFLKYFSLDVSYQYQRQQTEGIQQQDLESYEARNLINLFSQLNRNTGVVSYNVPVGGIRNNTIAGIESQTARAQLNFDQTWQSLHQLTGIVGAERREADAKGSAYSSYGFIEDPLISGTVDFKNSYSTFINGTRQFIPGSPFYSSTVQKFVSMYSNLAYTYDRRYSFSASARKDGSNIFGVNTNDKWKPLWSIGLGWTISNEKFYDLPFLQFLKFRISYGYSGNVDLSKSAVPIQQYTAINPLTGLPKGRIAVLNDPELRWEKVGQINLGLDFSFRNQIISGSVEYYHKKGSDLYGPTPYDYTSWGFVPVITKNVANMEGDGFDISIRSKNMDNFMKWHTSFLFNYNVSKTTAYFSEGANEINQLFGNGRSIAPVVGKPLYALAAYKWGGVDESGNPQGYVDGKLSKDYAAIINEANTKGTEGNVEYLGPALPKIFGSLLNSFEVDRFSFSVNLSYNLGYYFRKPAISYNQLIQQGRGHADFEKRWQKPGDELHTDIPSFQYPNSELRDNFYVNSTLNALKGDHVRLNFINLGYTLTNKSIGKADFKEIQFYVNMANLGILWRANKENLDPEYPSSLKPTKSIAFGLRTSF
jgi:TonB-linked SusC/RagA family outer membrane protein